MDTTDQAAKLVADSLAYLARQAQLPAIEQVSHDGSTVRFRASFAPPGEGFFVVTVQKEG